MGILQSRWKFICAHFGFEVERVSEHRHNCCDNCKLNCSCEECELNSVLKDFDLTVDIAEEITVQLDGLSDMLNQYFDA